MDERLNHEENQTDEVLTNSSPNEKSPTPPDSILYPATQALRDGKLQTAETMLLDLLEKKSITKAADIINCYAHLIRIAGEIREFQKIPAYLNQIKSFDIKSDEETIAFARCLFQTAVSWNLEGEYGKAQSYLIKAHDLAVSKNDSELEIACLTSLIETKRRLGNLNEAQAKLAELKQHPKLSERYLYNLLIVEGDLNRKLGDLKKAISCYQEAMAKNSNKNGSQFHYILWALGTSFAGLEDVEKAEIYLGMAMSGTEGAEFWRINVRSKLTLSELYTVTGDFAKATKFYQKIQEKLAGDEASYFGRRMLRGMINLYLRSAEFEKANELIDRLVLISVKDGKASEVMRLRLLKAEVLLRTGEAAQHDEARTMLQEALAFYTSEGSRKNLAFAKEVMARLDSRAGFAADALQNIKSVIELSSDSSMDRLTLRAELAKAVLDRKLGKALSPQKVDEMNRLINRYNAEPERIILRRFTAESYDEWSRELRLLEVHAQRYVNDFFEDFHFVPQQSVDLEIDRNSHYVREKHLGEVPFHNKFTLMRILLLLAETPGKEFSKEQLAKEIWGQEYNPLRHDNNIYININRLRKLIEPNPRESRYVMNGAQGYYLNPAVKVNISSKISEVAPRSQANRLTGNKILGETLV